MDDGGLGLKAEGDGRLFSSGLRATAQHEPRTSLSDEETWTA